MSEMEQNNNAGRTIRALRGGALPFLATGIPSREISESFVLSNPVSGGTYALKAQLHCHSTNSDGEDTPAEVASAYSAAGYDVLSITDHNPPYSGMTDDPGFSGIFIEGEEVDMQHIGYLPDEPSDSHCCNYAGTTKKNYGHASYAVGAGDIPPASWPFGLAQIYNAPNEQNKVTNIIDEWITRGDNIWLLAADDCHDVSGVLTPFNLGWTIIYTDEKSAAAAISAIEAGNMYASSGNDLSVSIDGAAITASSSEASDFYFIGLNGLILGLMNNSLSATYTAIGWEQYIRIKSVKCSNRSHMAWWQPIHLVAD